MLKLQLYTNDGGNLRVAGKISSRNKALFREFLSTFTKKGNFRDTKTGERLIILSNDNNSQKGIISYVNTR